MLRHFAFSTRSIAKYLGAAVCASALAVGVARVRGDDPKPTIKEIMKTMHKGDDSVVKQIIAGKGTQSEIDQLLADYKIMAEMDPPRGDKASWKAKTGKLIEITSTLKPDDKAGLANFKAAVSCRDCHSVHRPPQKK
jgi:hypothetical protein